MIRVAIYFVAIALLVPGNVQAELNQQESERTQPGYIVEVIGGGGKVVETVGVYLDFEEARKAEQSWYATHPDSLALVRIREGQVKVTPRSSQKKNNAEAEVPLTGPRGGTIVQPSPGNKPNKKWVMWLEERRGGNWGEVAGKRFDYDDYDQFRSAYKDYLSKVEPLNRNGKRYQVNWKEINLITKPDLPFVDAEPIAPKPKNVLAGRKGKGTINTRTIFIQFGEDGKTVSAWTQSRQTTEKPYTGEYSITGDTVRFVLGPSTFTGTIVESGVAGSRRRADGVHDTWDLTFER